MRALDWKFRVLATQSGFMGTVAFLLQALVFLTFGVLEGWARPAVPINRTFSLALCFCSYPLPQPGLSLLFPLVDVVTEEMNKT